MVWWVDSDRYCVCRSRFFYHETAADILNDRIFQTTNIMYRLDNSSYDEYQILSLVKSGVNIFNVDLSMHDIAYCQKIKEVINAFENLPQIFPGKYRSPVGLAITITVNDPPDIEEGIDIIILKDVINLKILLEVKKKYNNISVPLMIWITSIAMEDLKQIVQFTDGVFLDVNEHTKEKDYSKVIQMCKQAYKSVFFVMGDITKDYRSLPADDLHVLAVGNKIIKHQVDGVMLLGSNYDHNEESQLVRSLVGAMDIMENETNRDFHELSLTTKTPVLPWISASLAASLAAKRSGASIIVVLTTSGVSARWIANAAPPCYVVAVTTRKDIARRLHLYRKVLPLFYEQAYAANWYQECWNRVVFATTVALDIGLCPHGGNVVILAPSDEDIQYCNSLQILSVPLKCEVTVKKLVE